MTSDSLSQLEKVCQRIKFEKNYVELCLNSAESNEKTQGVDKVSNSLNSPSTTSQAASKRKAYFPKRKSQSVKLVPIVSKNDLQASSEREVPVPLESENDETGQVENPISITIPPNTSDEDFKRIIQVALKAFKEHQETGDPNQVVVTGKLSAQRSEAPICLEKTVSSCLSTVTKQSTPLNLEEIFSSSGTEKGQSTATCNPQLANNHAATAERKKNPPEKNEKRKKSNKRKPCLCPNCLKIGVRKPYARSPSSALLPRIHVCHYKDCTKEFKTTSRLQAHLCTHTGERPHVCKVEGCHQAFVRSDDLIRHTRIHTKEKRFICGICEKSFFRKDQFNVHMEGHIIAMDGYVVAAPLPTSSNVSKPG